MSTASKELFNSQPLKATIAQTLNRYFFAEIIFLVCIIFFVAMLLTISATRDSQNDFAHYYVSSQLYLEGESEIYGVNLKPRFDANGWTSLEEPVYVATNPPPLIQFFSLYAAFPPKTAHTAWMITQAVALFILMWVSFQFFRDDVSRSTLTLIGAAFLLSAAVQSHFFFSQIQILLALFVMSAFYFHRKKQSEIACLFIVLATLLKIFPVILLPWFVLRSGVTWKRRIKVGIAAGAMLLVGFWVTDLKQWYEFSLYARDTISIWAMLSRSFSISSVLGKIGLLFCSDWTHQTGHYLFSVGNLISFVLLAGSYLLFWRRTSSATDERFEFSYLICLMLVCVPTCWEHYYVFLMLPLAAFALSCKRNITPLKVMLITGLILSWRPDLCDINDPAMKKMIILHIPFWTILILMFVMASETVKSRSKRGEPMQL